MQHRFRKVVVLYAAVVLPMVAIGAITTTALFANNEQATNIRLTLPKTTYSVGEPVVFTLYNDGENTFHVENHCPGEPLSVYREISGFWTRIHDSASASKCSQNARTYPVEPGGSASASYVHWTSLFAEPGKYRIEVEHTVGQDVPAQEFVVQ